VERSESETASASFFYFKRRKRSVEARTASSLASDAALLEIIDISPVLLSIFLFNSSPTLSTSALASWADLAAYSSRSYLNSSFA
jgi:hypothetical protein